jgi:hypothetical protein
MDHKTNALAKLLAGGIWGYLCSIVAVAALIGLANSFGPYWALAPFALAAVYTIWGDLRPK